MAVKMDSIQAVLSPLFLISYVLGTRIVEFPAGVPRLLCSFLYILLLWSIYIFLFLHTIIRIISYGESDTVFILLFIFWLNTSIALLTIFLGMFYDKKYRDCLKLLNVVDDSLEKIGMITDYQKLYTKMLLIIFGWIAYVICITCINTLWFRDYFSPLHSFYMSAMIVYSSYINILDDLIITITLGYIELKFEQLKEYLRKLDRNNEHGIKRAWKHLALLPCQIGYSKSVTNQYATWVVIHLHLELCKISRKLNLVFRLQMTIKMGVYFILIALAFYQIFMALFTTKYNEKKDLFFFMNTTGVALYIFRVVIINYICEKVSVKANAIGDVINTIPYSTIDVVVRENISQFVLQINLTPLKFYGLGLFKFGLKFFYGFFSSILTVIVLLVQSYTKV